MTTRRFGGLVAALALVVASLVAAAAPAVAHASLIGSDPAQGEVLAAPPDSIRFAFTESVGLVAAHTRVLDAEGAEIGSTAKASGTELVVTPSSALGQGTFIVVWRVVSADGHPVTGSLSFSVGAPSDDVVAPPSAGGAADAPFVLGVARVGGYVALFLVTGLVGFAVLLLPSGPTTSGARRRIASVARPAAIVTAVVWLATLPLTASYVLGSGAGALLEASTWSAMPMREYAVTFVVVAGVLAAAWLLGREAAPRSRARVAAVAAAVAIAAPAFTGHARAESPVALVVGADVLHLVAGSTWVGGLVGLILALRELAGRGDEAASTLTRFSGVAAGILVVLAATGSLLGWRILASWDALFATGYGRLLIAKVAVVVVVVALAAWNRYRLLPRVRDAGRRDERAAAETLLRAVRVEVSALAVVLALTGFLVDRSPEAEVAAVERERNSVQQGTLGDVEVAATMTPLITGTNKVTIRMKDATGEPFEGFEAPEVSLSRGESGLGGIELTNLGPGYYTGTVSIPTEGTWELRISLRTSEFENPVETLTFAVDPAS